MTPQEAIELLGVEGWDDTREAPADKFVRENMSHFFNHTGDFDTRPEFIFWKRLPTRHGFDDPDGGAAAVITIDARRVFKECDLPALYQLIDTIKKVTN